MVTAMLCVNSALFGISAVSGFTEEEPFKIRCGTLFAFMTAVNLAAIVWLNGSR